MRKIKYIGYYDVPDSDSEIYLAGVDKMNYIIASLEKNGFSVDVFSPVISQLKKFGHKKAQKKAIHSNSLLLTGPSITGIPRYLRKINYLYGQFWLFITLLCVLKRGEKIIVYHSVISIPFLWLLRVIKRIKIILELEEVFHFLNSSNRFKGKMESAFISKADGYILSNYYIKTKINFGIKDLCVVHGNYSRCKLIKNESLYADKINVVFAGMIEHIRNGAFNSVEVSRYLNSDYVIHILGYSDNAEIIDELFEQITKINLELGYTACIYHGRMQGEEYDAFLNSCQIALNPQNISDFMDYAFPSKILSYLTHNLRVVSTKLNSLLNSDVSDHIIFSETDLPQDFANLILKIDTSIKCDNIEYIEDLDTKFQLSLRKLLT